jgi:septum site-determining protein MinC
MAFLNSGFAQAASHTSFEIKSAQLPLVALMLKTSDWVLLAKELTDQFGPAGESPDFFDHDALVIDFSQLQSDPPLQDMVPLLKALRTCNLVPVAIRAASLEWMAAGLALGLVEATAEVQRVRVAAEAPQQDVEKEIRSPVTMVIDKPLRSGQKVYARGGDLVVLAMVNQGAEVVADGNIHVYAPLRGKAMAGARGNANARIFSLCLDPELVSIAGVYRTSENPLPAGVVGKPAQVRLSDDGLENLIIEPLKG